MLSPRTTTLAALAALAVFVSSPARAQSRNYIALGDSYAFGYTTPNAPSSFGDQGYVAPFADFLATRFGGVRPTVTNLAIPGETSTSFFTGAPTVFNNQAPYPDGLIDAPGREQARNDNYPDLPFPQFSPLGTPLPGNAQSLALQSRLAQIKAGGGTTDIITIQMGGNDILALFGQSAFTSLSSAQQNQVLQSQFLNLQTRYANLLTSLANPNTGAPGAQILLVGYADPFAGLGANNPLAGPDPAHPLSTQLTLTTNALIQGIANNFGVRYVDIYTPFVGNELAYTYIGDPNLLPGGSPNFHPNATGYNVISQRIVASASAPEPNALFLFVLAAPAGVLHRARRRRGRV